MKISLKNLPAVMAVLGWVPAWAQSGSEQDPAAIKAALSGARLSVVQAIENARQKADEGSVVGADLLADEKAPQYVVKFLKAGRILEVKVDAVDGKVLSTLSREAIQEHREWADEFPKAFERSNLSP
ncbi:MAG TPA: PepSY domain-containing protein, partial [Phycisphaerae bacterium]|nr:PepSY domain-containing protein [Phycisphaerae bacterium]